MNTINFDNVAGAKHKSVAINNMGGLHFDNMFVTDASQQSVYTGSGVQKGTTSGSQAAYGGYGHAGSVSVTNGTFSLKTVEMSAAWAKSLTVDVAGLDASGHVLDHTVVTLSDSGPQLETFNWDNISSVRFTPLASERDPAMGNIIGNNFVIDDLTIDNIQHQSALGHLAHSAADFA